MILPGHLAASSLAHRYLRADLPVALVAGVLPDLVDKGLYYLTRLTPNSRVPAHTLLAWVVSSLALLGLAWLIGRRWLWGYSWFLGYGLHLLCDSPMAAGELPFLYPFRAYAFTSPDFPLDYLLDFADWPWVVISLETALVLITIGLELRRRRAAQRRQPQAVAP